jgi:hypothetical protein
LFWDVPRTNDFFNTLLEGKSRRGRDQKADALEIAKAAATDYLDLTGRIAKRSYKDSSFVDFLAAIFKALGKRYDSPDTFARQAIKWLKNDSVREDEDAIRKWMTNPPPNLEDGPVALPQSWWQRCHLRQWVLEE